MPLVLHILVLHIFNFANISLRFFLFFVFFLALSRTSAFRSLLEGDEFFQVPEVIDELSGQRVLAMELVQGVPLDMCVELDQETRNQVCFTSAVR